MQARVKALADQVGGEMPDKVTKWLATPAANDLTLLHERATLLKATVAA
jgi:hypothetical protein